MGQDELQDLAPSATSWVAQTLQEVWPASSWYVLPVHLVHCEAPEALLYVPGVHT